MHHVTSYVQEGLDEVIKTQNILTRGLISQQTLSFS